MSIDGASQAGLLSAIVGNIVINVALNLQRYARRRLVRLALHGLRTPSAHTLLSWTGAGLLIAGECATFVGYGLAPASIVSPLGVFAVISNCVVPPLLFDETPTMHGIVGTITSLPGIFLLIISAPSAAVNKFPLPLTLVQRYYVISLLLVAIVLSLLQVQLAKTRSAYMRVSAVLSALLGSWAVLCIKCLGIMYQAGAIGDRGGVVAALVATSILSTLMQFVFLMDVLDKFPVWQVIPHHYVAFIGFVAVGSGTLFREFSNASVGGRLEFISGVALLVVGVWIAAKPHEAPLTHRPSFIRPKVRFSTARVRRVRRRASRKVNAGQKRATTGDSSLPSMSPRKRARKSQRPSNGSTGGLPTPHGYSPDISWSPAFSPIPQRRTISNHSRRASSGHSRRSSNQTVYYTPRRDANAERDATWIRRQRHFGGLARSAESESYIHGPAQPLARSLPNPELHFGQFQPEHALLVPVSGDTAFETLEFAATVHDDVAYMLIPERYGRASQSVPRAAHI